MPAEAPTAASDQDGLAYSDAAGCKAWLSRLPSTRAQCHRLLLAQARVLPGAAVDPGAKLEILELLRQPVAEAQAAFAKSCRGRPLPLNPNDGEAWHQVLALWQAMAAGYDSLIDAMATTTPDLALHAALICQRALRYTAAAMFEYCHVYHAVPGTLWQQLHRLYIFSETADQTATVVNDPVDRRQTATSCGRIYVHALLLHLAQPDSLTGAQLDTVDRCLERWESLVTLSAPPPPPGAIPPVVVDVASQKGAGLADKPAGAAASIRHLALEPLSQTLRQTIASLKQQTPAQLGLGDLPREACERLLIGLHLQWCAAGTGRTDTRTPASIKVMISPNIASMHFHLTGKAFRQPGGELTAAERQRLDMFGTVASTTEKALASQRSTAFETWVIVNQSVSGFLGTTQEKEVVNRVSHHQLVALQPPARKVMYIGIVQRLSVDDSGTMWIGLRVILGTPQPVAVRPVDAALGVTAKYERALLMPEDAARKIPASVLLMPGFFAPNRTLTVLDEQNKERRIRLSTLLDSGDNFERAAYTAA